ncbi:thiamine phosphate synthase [Halobacillus sp. Marseille-P3879]|uniref:thiamine phosphate synthase n=1 Tax=Halobacillus TaxID=45667 RepID=UPI0013584024|nr:thiamine phosphate synthase [Halobacillus sp. Marseille-P3879]
MKLIAVTNGAMKEEVLSAVIQEVVSFVDAVILREKQKSAQAYLEFVKELLNAGVSREKLWIHDRADIAWLTGVDNLHLPEAGLPVEEVKKHFPFMKVGKSVHSLKSAHQAQNQGADYVMFGHVFPTASKQGLNARGIDQLKELTSTLHIPVIAIGGITSGRMGDISASGAEGAAVMSGIFNAATPLEAARQYQKEAVTNDSAL